MKARWIVSAIVASALTAPAFAQVGIYIGSTPPPLRYEVEGPMPGPGYVWTEGSWGWDGASIAHGSRRDLARYRAV